MNRKTQDELRRYSSQPAEVVDIDEAWEEHLRRVAQPRVAAKGPDRRMTRTALPLLVAAAVVAVLVPIIIHRSTTASAPGRPGISVLSTTSASAETSASTVGSLATTSASAEISPSSVRSLATTSTSAQTSASPVMSLATTPIPRTDPNHLFQRTVILQPNYGPLTIEPVPQDTVAKTSYAVAMGLIQKWLQAVYEIPKTKLEQVGYGLVTSPFTAVCDQATHICTNSLRRVKAWVAIYTIPYSQLAPEACPTTVSPYIIQETPPEYGQLAVIVTDSDQDVLEWNTRTDYFCMWVSPAPTT